MVDKRLAEPAKAVVARVGDAVHETAGLLTQSGPLKPGLGLASGVLALVLAFLCLLGVAASTIPNI